MNTHGLYLEIDPLRITDPVQKAAFQVAMDAMIDYERVLLERLEFFITKKAKLEHLNKTMSMLDLEIEKHEKRNNREGRQGNGAHQLVITLHFMVGFTGDEIIWICRVAKTFIEKTIEEIENGESKKEDPTSAGSKIGIGNTQLVLLFWYGMRSLGMQPGKDFDKSRFARVLHLITSKECNDIDDSDLYKKLRSAPEIHKTTINNLRELEKVKVKFEAIGTFSDVIEMIESDMLKIRNGSNDID